MRAVIFIAWLLALGLGCGNAFGEDSAAAEAAHRAAVLARLPPDAAQVLFGNEAKPATGPPEAIGTYTAAACRAAPRCPPKAPPGTVMRPSRNRAWGHPVLIAWLERLAQKLPAEARWPGLLVGDIAQPRGGPMLTGHASHQIGLDADIWLTPMPSRPLGPAEREEMSATDVVAADGEDVDATTWTPRHRQPARGGRARTRCGADLCQPGDQARAVPRGGGGPRLAGQDPAMVGS